VPRSSFRAIWPSCIWARRNSRSRTHPRSSLETEFSSFLLCSSPRSHPSIRGAGRTRRGTILTTVDQSDIRVLVNAYFDSSGLPHPTSERPAHPEPGSGIARGFPPYRTNAAACSSNFPGKCPRQVLEVYESMMRSVTSPSTPPLGLSPR
jgi:hypothetical protein